MRQGLSYFQETIFDGLPTFYRRIDTALSKIGQPHLPLTHNLFTFGSWMGGDRDGNPFVTPETTRDVVISARLTAVNLYFKAIERLMFELSVWRCSDEMRVSRLQPYPITSEALHAHMQYRKLHMSPQRLAKHSRIPSGHAGITCCWRADLLLLHSIL